MERDKSTELTTSDSIVESVLRIDDPVEAFAKKYISVYARCMEILDDMLALKKSGGNPAVLDPAEWSDNTAKLWKLERAVLRRFLVNGAVPEELGRVAAIIEGTADYGSCTLLLDDLRGRPVKRYVPEEDSEGLDDDVVFEPVLEFMEYDKVIPSKYTKEFKEFVGSLETEMKRKLDVQTGEAQTGKSAFQIRSSAIRDLVIEYSSEYPDYKIHRILSGAILPCVKGD